VRKVKSCGVLLFSAKQPLSFLLLCHPNRYDLPKGHIEYYESERDCALRELSEETGIQPHLVTLHPTFRYVETYYPRYRRFGGEIVQKTLVIFLGHIEQAVPVETTEHANFSWVNWSPPHQLQKITIDPLLVAAESIVASIPRLRQELDTPPASSTKLANRNGNK
jgi:bis(5'-nucleosidyl)-tetraphosphatase